MQLDEQQRRHLRGLAHSLKPIVRLGSGGMSPGVLAELDRSLKHHELVKVKVAAGSRSNRDMTIQALAEQCQAALVSRVGNTAVLYRPNPEQPRLVLPDRQEEGPTLS